MAPAWRIAQPYCVALAPQINSPEPLWYIGCKVMTGEDKLFYSQTYFETNYTDLVRWTKTLPNASSACFVTFGLNSYFACAAGSGSIWAGIPSAHDAWFVLWPNGDCSWKFNGHYKALDKILNEAAPRSVSYVAISPYNKNHYFVAFRDQSIKYDFTGAPPEWMKLMTEVFDAWRAERLKKPRQQYFPPPGVACPQAQPYQPPQPQQQAAYYYNNAIAEIPSVPAHAFPMSPPLTPSTPSTGYPSPAPQQAAPDNSFGYRPRPQWAIEMPVELPGDTTLATPAPVPVRTVSTEKKKRFKLF
ncbi:hypothetical protein E8E12_008384 [Didymella heteroderae]|uniref:Uncharacterized protein n=1 Tax=Didymella heteroderae TaxID=1769908 RepID=A0A9P4WST7_9PLEO|nr:hypothetical protein E8E12_008384 [Didymella heteroderae]